MKSVNAYIAALLCAVISVQFGATLAKQLFPLVGSIGATMLRLSLASLILCAISRPWRGKLDKAALKSLLLYGISLGLMNITFYLAIERIPLGIAVALEFTGPLILAILSSRKVLDFLWAILAIAGIVLILPYTHSVGSLDPLGLLFALIAGFFWIFYIIFGQKLGSSLPGGKATSLGMLIGMLVVIPFYFFSSSTHAESINLELMPLAFGVAIFSSALPFSLEMIAMRGLPTRTFSILLSLEPVVAALSGLIFIHEHLNWTQWFAILCIMAASIGSALSAKQSLTSRQEVMVSPSL